LHLDNIFLEKVSVYNTLGKLVKDFTFTLSKKNNTLNLAGIEKGVYYVYLQSEGNSTFKKIILE
jgi:hypothetical protein